MWTERATADETIEHEGDLLGPLAGAELLDKHPFLVALHCFPDVGGTREELRKQVSLEGLVTCCLS